MADILLSFCIGTYNQANIVSALVKNILTCKREDIEVAVTDNASTDNTKEVLSLIKDERFHYYRNDKNIGGMANWTRAAANAKGKYAFYCMDRDRLIVANIPALCDFLSKHDLTFVYCGDRTRKNTIFKEKYKALFKLYREYHPTGIIYNTEKLKKIPNLGWFEREENVGFCPQPFIAANLCLMGDSALIKNIYWMYRDEKNDIPKSYAHNRRPEEYAFHPQTQFRDTLLSGEYLLRINKDFNACTITQIRRLLLKSFIRNSLFATIVFKAWIRYKHQYLIDHYGIDFKKYSSREMYKMYIDYFYNKYRNSDLFLYYSSVYKSCFFIFKLLLFVMLYVYNIYGFIAWHVFKKLF